MKEMELEIRIQIITNGVELNSFFSLTPNYNLTGE